MAVPGTETIMPAADPPTRRWVPVRLGLLFAGVVALMLALLSFPWFVDKGPEGGQPRIPFSTLDEFASFAPATTFATVFEATIWVCGAVATSACVVSFMTFRALLVVRLVGVAASALALAAIGLEVRPTTYRTYGQWFDLVSVDLWTAVIGFVLIGIGAGLSSVSWRATKV